MTTMLRIGCYQFGPTKLDPERNLRILAKAFEAVDLDLAVLPELAPSGYFFASHDEVAALAEEIPGGPTTQAAMEWARESGAHVVVGLPEVDGSKFYNSAVLVGPEGYVGRYRKNHLFYEEKIWFQPGNEGFPVFNVVSRTGVEYRLGMMICFDWFFPESTRALARRGADIVAHPSNLVKEWCPTAMPIRALENHVFTATANRIGTESNGKEQLTFIGSSLVCGPEGNILSTFDRTSTGWIVASCDVKQARDKEITPRNRIFEDLRADYQ